MGMEYEITLTEAVQQIGMYREIERDLRIQLAASEARVKGLCGDLNNATLRLLKYEEGLRETKIIALSIIWGHPPREEIIGSAKVIARRVDTLLGKVA